MNKSPLMWLMILLTLLLINSIHVDKVLCKDLETAWQAGIARVDITPTDSLWMSGYSSRDHAAEGTLHTLWAKALAFKDHSDNRGVLVTSDLIGFPKEMAEHIALQCEQQYGLKRSQIILSSSHTHTGPVLRKGLYNIYPLDNNQKVMIDEYSIKLENDIVKLVGDALDNMVPVRISTANGVVRFQVNRRNNKSGSLNTQSDLNGPNDYAVPVLQVHGTNNNLLAVAFGYACHATVLNSYHWSGDYPGFAQIELEKQYAGTTALFFQGCGADQNPLPRRSVPLARQYGKELAAAVERVIVDKNRYVGSGFKSAFGYVDLAFSSLPDTAVLEKLANDTTAGYTGKWALQLLEKLDNNGSIPQSYPYPVQVWQLGNQTIIALGGEVVVDYAIQLKRILGQDTFVLGYCNDVMGYIPSVRVLREGGYEGASAQIVYDLPSTWQADIENQIIYKILQLTKELNIKLPESSVISN